ncbi:nucleoside hydrolase [Dactylosporangium cerinum]|uniref:Nucleoside hydrolase n=1 Tax=Dactylosporangium cerinum TaxID=1434730 RepID=A0ABV9VTY7_9ACTN
MDVIWDMETSDPDDFITLLLLLGHPRVNLIGVTVTPGTPDQVGVVRRALDWFGRSIPVGAFNLGHTVRDPGQGGQGRRGACVSSWHYAAFGDMPPSTDAVPGPELLRDLCGPSTTLVTGAPLKNLGGALKLPGFQLGEVVVQGGFAGAGVVPPERQLEKFRGLATCPSYNLNGDSRSALAVIAAETIARKRFVSKNVCHGVVYDRALHAEVAAVRDRATSLRLIWQGMDRYLDKHAGRPAPPRNTAITATEVRLAGDDGSLNLIGRDDAIAGAAARGLDLVAVTADAVPVCRAMPPAVEHRESADPQGKMLHDPLAACCAIDPSIAQWAEVDLYRERGAWGSRLAPGSGVFITVGHDHAKFVATLLES